MKRRTSSPASLPACKISRKALKESKTRASVKSEPISHLSNSEMKILNGLDGE